MFNYYVLLYLLTFVNAIDNGKKSFTVVVDTTASMREEIDILKSNIGSVLNGPSFDTDNFILVPYDDPNYGPPIVVSTPSKLVELVSIMEVSGGQDCPENTMPAIEQALTVSKPNSHIFVFTDGYAKDYRKLSSIQNLCRSSNNQVIIFLSGKCVPIGSKVEVGTIDPYFDIAESCSGSVIQFELFNFRQVFKLMRELSKTEWTHIDTHKVYIGPKQFTISVDMYTKEVMVAISGGYSSLEFKDTDGRSPALEIIVVTQNSKVMRFVKPAPGVYTVDILCQGPTLATSYVRRELDFQFGFSPKLPRSMKETSRLPLPGSKNYISIAIAEISIELNAIHVRFDNSDVKVIKIEIVDRSLGLYAAQEYFEPAKSFKITIYGRDESYQVIKGTTGVLKPQAEVLRPMAKKPRIEMIIPQETMVDFKANVTIACKVSGYPKPTISWHDEAGIIFPSEDALLETPSIFISYAFIEKVTKNSTIYCKCESSEGEDTLSMNLFVNKTFTFEVLKYPQDSTFEYSTEGQLFCEVDAYPEATIKWYHNDSLVENSDELEIVPDENMILIKNMTLDLTGEYRCEISNTVESKTYTANVDISGIESPQIELSNSEYVFLLDDWVNIECTLNKGKPTPTLNWKFKTANGFEDIPEGVSAEDNQLKIPAVKTNHAGTYRCEAVNFIGSDSKEVLIKVQYAPKITFCEKLKTVKKYEVVELPCEVHAIPKAQVRWEKTQNDVVIPLETRHEMDDWNTLSFIASSDDSGDYHCVASNSLGTVERIVTLNVLVPPYIDPPPFKMITIRPGDTVTLPCRARYGHPVPTTKWEFIALNSTVTTLLRGSATNDLILRKVSKRDEGSYICLAENEAGSDTIKVILKVL